MEFADLVTVVIE
jgi:hypothetical protein